MDNDLYAFLSTNKIFSSLSRRALKRILSQFEKIELNPGEILYYQGDPSDSVEILLTGKLVAVLTTVTGENKNIGEVSPGEMVGELGALTNQPRAVTVKAIKTSTLAKLPTSVFSEVCREYPGVLLEIIHPIVSRSQQIMQIFTSERFKKNIVLIAANEAVDLTIFSDQLKEHLSGFENITFISEYDLPPESNKLEKIQLLIDETKKKTLKKTKPRFIFLLKAAVSALAQYSFEHVDMVYVVGFGNSIAYIDDFVLDKLIHYKNLTKDKPELILLHSSQAKLPKHSINWLSLTEFRLHHQVRLYQSSDFRRLVRFIRNKAIGLVLGGGGTRGWGHLGVIKALLDAGIPIDAIGGTSVGAIIAANYAITGSFAEAEKQFNIVIERSRYSVSWRSLTWPAISIFNAKGLTQGIQEVFSNIQIEDLWLPYFCVSTNFATNSEEIHTKGSLWEKVRASCSMPGIVPPMLLNGQLHFDGGLLNNLPVDIMRKIITQRGTVIAVELSDTINDEHVYRFPPILTFWQTLLSKLGIAYDYKFPRFVDTFLKSLLVGSSLKTQKNTLAADMVISLELAPYPMLYSNKKYEKKLIEIGYETATNQIKNMKKI